MTTDSKKAFNSFQEYFSIRTAVTAAEREETYRIRYRVYCDEFGYEPAGRFPDRMEVDAFDPIATHCLITHIASGLPAGCVRICPGSVAGVDQALPYEQCCAASLDARKMSTVSAPREQICEASRFAVDGAFRRRSGESLTRFGEIAALDLADTERRTFPLISATLLLAATALAELMDRPYVFALMEPFLPRLFKRSGLMLHRMGRDVNHHGTRAVYFSHSHMFVQALEHGDFGRLYEWIHQQLQDTSPPSGVSETSILTRRANSG